VKIITDQRLKRRTVFRDIGIVLARAIATVSSVITLPSGTNPKTYIDLHDLLAVNREEPQPLVGLRFR
jgi:hypothetical protein